MLYGEQDPALFFAKRDHRHSTQVGPVLFWLPVITGGLIIAALLCLGLFT